MISDLELVAGPSLGGLCGLVARPQVRRGEVSPQSQLPRELPSPSESAPTSVNQGLYPSHEVLSGELLVRSPASVSGPPHGGPRPLATGAVECPAVAVPIGGSWATATDRAGPTLGRRGLGPWHVDQSTYLELSCTVFVSATDMYDAS